MKTRIDNRLIAVNAYSRNKKFFSTTKQNFTNDRDQKKQELTELKTGVVKSVKAMNTEMEHLGEEMNNHVDNTVKDFKDISRGTPILERAVLDIETQNNKFKEKISQIKSEHDSAPVSDNELNPDLEKTLLSDSKKALKKLTGSVKYAADMFETYPDRPLSGSDSYDVRERTRRLKEIAGETSYIMLNQKENIERYENTVRKENKLNQGSLLDDFADTSSEFGDFTSGDD